MEFAIPISRFDPSHIRWGQPRVGPFRRTIPFGYEDSQITFHSLILVLEPLYISSIDWDRNQVVLEESPHTISFLAKLEQFQKLVNIQLLKKSKEWLDGTEQPDPDSVSPLQPWLKSRRLTLYLSPDPSGLPFTTETGKATFSNRTIKPGDLIRAVIKLHGISLQMSQEDVWTGKSRIQHHVLELYKVKPDLSEQ